MPDYKHILVATDLAKGSEKLSKKGVELAEQWGADLSLVHVVDYGPMMYGGGEFAIPLDAEIDKNLSDDAKKKLKKQAKKVGVPIENQWITHGQTKEEIIELAKRIKADLILIGGHDQRWLHLVFGSTANALLHNLPCDILTLRLEKKA